ncbi:MAG: hypothetical protein JWR80_693 [Bradyrhizobium sp.]|nr:hypothetical protein [Bradyrhizobium sp.]
MGSFPVEFGVASLFDDRAIVAETGDRGELLDQRVDIVGGVEKAAGVIAMSRALDLAGVGKSVTAWTDIVPRTADISIGSLVWTPARRLLVPRSRLCQ